MVVFGGGCGAVFSRVSRVRSVVSASSSVSASAGLSMFSPWGWEC